MHKLKKENLLSTAGKMQNTPYLHICKSTDRLLLNKGNRYMARKQKDPSIFNWK